jgi:hypothetical protein
MGGVLGEVMRFAGDVGAIEPVNSLVASDYEDRKRHREEARVLYDMILKGELGDPSMHQDTLKRLQNQISGIELRGV